MHIYVFVHFSEASLGIEPHFDFFRTLYKLVPLPFSKMLDRVGCTHLELQEKVAKKYLVFFPKIALSVPNGHTTGFTLGILRLVFLGSVLSRPSG